MSVRVQSDTIDLNHQLLDTLSMLRSLVGERIAVSVLMGTGLGAVRVDPTALHRAILDLARKADEAMPCGGSLVIETRNACLQSQEVCEELGLSPGAYVCLSVSDTGKTPNSENLPSLSDCSSPELRLAPIYLFAKQHGGTAKIRSEPDGTTLSLYLPQVPKEVSALSVKDEADELRVEFLRKRWQGIEITPSAAQTSKLQEVFDPTR